MQALFGYSTFYLPSEDRPYMETYLQFDAWTMQFVQQSSGVYKATVEVTLVVRQGDSVCVLKKYDLNSPTVASLDELDFSFIDVQRFSLGNGVYSLELTLRDKGSEAPAAVVNEKVVINYDREHPVISSLQPMSEVTPTVKQNMLSRGGYDMEPYISDYYPQQVEELKFYYEVYNIDKEIGHKPFVAMAYIEQYETGTRFEEMQHVARKNSAAVVPVFGSIDISNLPSGNYNLVVELRNRENQTMLYRKLTFYRSNPGVKGQGISDFATTFAGKYTDEDQLNTYIDALWAVASEMERNVAKDIIRHVGLEEKQAFLYRFWATRNPMAPEAEWLKYKERVDYVQSHFSYPRLADKPLYPQVLSCEKEASDWNITLSVDPIDALVKGENYNVYVLNDTKEWEKIGNIKVMSVLADAGRAVCEVKRGDDAIVKAVKSSTGLRLVSNTNYTPGIHTDRGRVYLQYGPPDFIRDEKNYVSANCLGEGGAHTSDIANNAVQASQPYVPDGMYQGNSQGHIYYLPYQLWRYNKLATDDQNRVFLFWDEHRSGYYTLLNSNARGEVQDPMWERRLSRQQLGENVLGEVGEQFNRGY